MSRKKVEKNIAYDDIKKTYYVNMDYGIGENGKQINKYKTFDKIKDARKALKEYEADKTKGTLIIPKVTTLKEWLEYYMNDIVKPNKAYTTVYGYENILNKHIIPELGEVQIQQLKPQQIQKYYSKLMDKNLSNNTIRKHHDFLKTSLSLAVKQDILIRNPIDKVEPPKVTQKDIEFYTAEQLQKLLELIEGDRLEVVVYLAVLLGLRRSEICGLKWENTDFNKKIITIKLAKTMAGSTIVDKKTKNKSSTRTLSMQDELLSVLLAEKEKQAQNKAFFGADYIDSDLVVVWENGKEYRPNYLSELFAKFITDNNLDKITIHGLRHSFATRANAEGLTLFDIGKAMGHATPTVTGKIYTHLEDNTHEQVMAKVADSLFKIKSKD